MYVGVGRGWRGEWEGGWEGVEKGVGGGLGGGGEGSGRELGGNGERVRSEKWGAQITTCDCHVTALKLLLL